MNRINAILQAYYGLKHPRIRSQQGGWTALAYQVTEGSQRYFVTYSHHLR